MTPERTASNLCRTANYLALNMLYATRYLPPGETVRASDVRDFAPGHWGCVPGLNFIWANLVTHAALTSNCVTPLVGTGHGGAAWVAWQLLNAADGAGGVSPRDLDDVIGKFGDDGRIPHELFGALPSLLWPSGELGYALAVGQGAALELANRLVVILGDGELEIGCTLSAIAAGPSLPRAPLVIVNANGFRMGSTSWFAQLPNAGRNFFTSLGWKHSAVAEGNVKEFQAALDDDCGSKPSVIVYLNQKGGIVPHFANYQNDPRAVHKLPIKKLNNKDSLAWFRRWLDSYTTPLLSDSGLQLETGGSIARSSCSLAQAPRNDCRIGTRNPALTEFDRGRTCVEMFVHQIALRDPEALVLSPDEASSNLVDRHGLETCEFLSEQLTFGWAIGAAAGGRLAIWASYEAFAPLISTMVVQFARHLALCFPDARPRCLPCIVLTSLSFRNVPSHQDVGFCADLERRNLEMAIFLVPPTATFSRLAASLAHKLATSAQAIPIVVLDKYSTGPDESDACTWKQERPDGWVAYKFGCQTDASPQLAILALGAVQFHEAIRAARSLIALGLSSSCDVYVLWKIGPNSRAAGIAKELAANYDYIAAVTGMDSFTWDRVLDPLRVRGQLIHSAAFTPTSGPNDVARLFECKLDWLAIINSVSSTLNNELVTKLTQTARVKLQNALQNTRTAQWYHDLEWTELHERINH